MANRAEKAQIEENIKRGAVIIDNQLKMSMELSKGLLPITLKCVQEPEFAQMTVRQYLDSRASNMELANFYEYLVCQGFIPVEENESVMNKTMEQFIRELSAILKWLRNPLPEIKTIAETSEGIKSQLERATNAYNEHHLDDEELTHLHYFMHK